MAWLAGLSVATTLVVFVAVVAASRPNLGWWSAASWAWSGWWSGAAELSEQMPAWLPLSPGVLMTAMVTLALASAVVSMFSYGAVGLTALLAWACGPTEPVGRGAMRALKAGWVGTSAVLLLAIVVAPALAGVGRVNARLDDLAEKAYYERLETQTDSGDPSAANTWQDWQALQLAIEADRAKRWPWLRWQEELMAWTIVGSLAGGFVLTGWLAIPGVSREACRWPPRCDGCGYALFGVTGLGSCPECGLAMSRALSAQGRPGGPMDRRGWAGLLAEPLLALARPGRLGRRMLTMGGAAGTPKGWAAAGLWALVLLIGCGPVLTATVVIADHLTRIWDPLSVWGGSEQPWFLTELWQAVALSGPIVGLQFAVWVFGLVGGAATVVGAVASAVARRSLLHVAARGAIALLPWSVLAIWLAVAWGIVLMIADRLGLGIDDLWSSAGGVELLIAVVLTFGPMLVLIALGAWCLAGLWRIVWAARLANR